MWNFLFRCMTSLLVVRGFSCSMAYGILVPQPGIEPTSPALQSEFLTTRPPGKSLFIFLLLILRVLCKFWTQVLYQICFSNTFFTVCGSSFHSLASVFCEAEVFNFNRGKLVSFSFMDYAFGVVSKKSLPNKVT